ncbi:YggS family pyridoxal phosphate-dependent enzyme [bacterium]|nr:YggS family pyridoxal phosphate-dependent enzyme [bacterium]
MGDIVGNLKTIRGRIEAAALRAGRDPASVTLVAVSKTHPAGRVREAIGAGQAVFGENRIQEALPKIEALAGLNARWHLIGHLQGNKARQAAGRFELIHSVDSPELIRELDKRAAAAGVKQKILLQINVAGEASKFGAAPDEITSLLDALSRAPNLIPEGLMTIPPLTDDPEASRPHFKRLRELLNGVRAKQPSFGSQLSMGMSDDYEVAIEEGATLVRVGTAIFGER